jgi:TPR repeat protein
MGANPGHSSFALFKTLPQIDFRLGIGLMKKPFRLLGASVLIVGTLLTSRAGVTAIYGNNAYVIGKAGNRARNAQILRNEAIRRQQQVLQQQQEQKAQQEQAAATNGQNAAVVPNPPGQNNAVIPANPYHVYRQIMPISTNALPKTKTLALSEQGEETPRSLPVSEYSGPAYNDRDPLLGYQQEQAQKGNPESQYAIGLRYLDGNGLVQSDALAREWLSKASSNGNLKARAKLRALDHEK